MTFSDAGLVVDMFAGGGGASTGIEAALGRPIDVAINHDPIAIAVHALNHPETIHLTESVYDVDPHQATNGRPVALLWASPDCTHFSVAKGDVPRSQKIRGLAWAAVRWAKAVRPRVIVVENVREFQSWGPLTDEGRPCKRHAGETFRRWVGELRELGYRVDWRILDAADYGAPTRRKRLFIVARRDARPITWPEPTHGVHKGQLPYRTAAECIDWSLPCPSIFERKRPLAEKTMWRIANGIRKYVLEAADPFIVEMNHSNKPRSVHEPLGTVTTQHNRFNLVSPTLIQTSWGERKGQAPRVPGLHKPLGTVVAGGCKHALVAAFLSKHFGGVTGHELTRPIGTVTARDHHALTAAHLVKLRGQCHGAPLDEPAPTITAGGLHVAEVRAFLTAYYGSDGNTGQSMRTPMRTITTKARLGLVTVHGVDYQIIDIGMRMLRSHELLRAQFGDFADTYSLDATKDRRGKRVPLAEADRIRLIGNSVAPNVSEALVSSLFERQEQEAAA